MGVRLSLVNEMSHGLMAVIGDLNKGETATKKLTESFGKLSLAGKTAFSGALAFGAGAAITAAMKPALDAAQRLQDAQISASEAGIHGSDMALLKAQAFNDAQKNLGTTIAGNTKLLTELFSVTGSMAGAVSLAPHLERVQKAMEWRGQNGDGQGYAEAKALEHRGDRVFQNPAIRDAEASAIERVNFATGGKVSPKDFLAASQTGKQAYQGYDSSFLTGALAAYIQVHSGSTAGSRGAMAARTLLGGHGDKKAKAFFQGLGLMGKSGNLTGDQAAAFAADPEKWINGPLRSAYMARHKGATDDQFSRDVAANTNGSTGDFLSWFITNREKVEKDQKVFAGADSGDQAYAKGKAGKTGAHDILLQSWENLLATLGTSLLPLATSATTKLAAAINSLTAFAEKHPMLTKFAMVGTALTGVILIVAGAVAVVGAGFAVLASVLAGVTAAGAATVAGFTVAVGGLIALGSWLHGLDWGAIWQGIKNGFLGFIGFIGEAWKHRPTWLGGDGATAVPKAGVNGATQADVDYYAALNSNKIAPKSTSVTVHTTNTLDGKVVGRHTATYIAKDLARSARGDSTTGPDYGAGLVNPGNS